MTSRPYISWSCDAWLSLSFQKKSFKMHVLYAALLVVLCVIPLGSALPSVPKKVTKNNKPAFEVVHWDEKVDGVLNYDNMYAKLKHDGYVVKTWIMPAGAKYPWHPHTFDEVETFITGKYRFRINDTEVFMNPGDLVHVPAGNAHDTEVIGNETVIFLQGKRPAGNLVPHLQHWDEAIFEAGTYAPLMAKMRDMGYKQLRPVLLHLGHHFKQTVSYRTVQAMVSSYCTVHLNGERFVLTPSDILEIPAGATYEATPYYLQPAGEPVLVIHGLKDD